MRIPFASALCGVVLLASTRICCAAEGHAGIETSTGKTFHGRIGIDGAALTITAAGGEVHRIDPQNLSLLQFETPRLPGDAEPFADGALPAPWVSAAVGELPRGGSVEVKNGSVILETSAPPRGTDFAAFYTAHRPLPDGDAQITVRVSRIDNYDKNTRSGIMMRDGSGMDARNVYLSVGHREPASVHNWKRRGGTTHTDLREDSKPGHWLRLVRAGGKITGYHSKDSGYWREIYSAEDQFEGPVIVGLAANGSRPRRRWSTVFDHISVSTLDELGELWPLRPRIALTDGTIFTSEIESATATLIRLGGRNAGRVVPTISLARVEFFYPLPSAQDRILAGDKVGALLSSGDFFEGKLEHIADGQLTARSPLFGNRAFALRGQVDALVLAPAALATPADAAFIVETWGGGRLYAKSLRAAGGLLEVNTRRLGSQKLRLIEVRQVRKSK